MLVGGKEDAVAVLGAIEGVGHGADADDVRRAEERDAVVRRQALTRLDLVRHGQEGAVVDQAPVHVHGNRHRRWFLTPENDARRA